MFGNPLGEVQGTDDTRGVRAPTHSFKTACPPDGGPSGGSPRRRPDPRPGARGLRRQHGRAPVDGTPDPGTEQQRRAEYASHEEFRNQYGLASIKAHYAYARGATGEGVTLGIVDTGVDPDHPRFEDKLEASYVGDYDPDTSACDAVGPDGACPSALGHGTFVAGIMAAARQETPDADAASGPAIHGVAFDARVISVGVDRATWRRSSTRSWRSTRTTPRPSRSKSSRRGSSKPMRRLREISSGTSGSPSSG